MKFLVTFSVISVVGSCSKLCRKLDKTKKVTIISQNNEQKKHIVSIVSDPIVYFYC